LHKHALAAHQNTVALNQHHLLGLDLASFFLKCKNLDSPREAPKNCGRKLTLLLWPLGRITPPPKGKLQNFINPENQLIITFLIYLYQISLSSSKHILQNRLSYRCRSYRKLSFETASNKNIVTIIFFVYSIG